MQAPEFPEKATWLGTSEPLSLAGFEGHVVLLDFWTYCCINCMHVLPVLDRLEKELESEPFHVIGVHAAKFDQEKDAANIQKAMRRHGVRHPCLVDSGHDLWKHYGVQAWPTLVLVGPSGEIVETLPGEPHFDDLLKKIRSLLDANRADGTLAKKKKQIAVPPEEKNSLLSYPGKVRFFPKGADDAGHLLVVTDTGHHRLLLAQISFGEDGWPLAGKTEFVGSGGVGQQDGPFGAASFRRPQGVDRNGQHLYVCDTENYLLRRVDLASKTVSTVAGNGRAHGGPTGASALQVPLRSPWDCAWVDGAVLLAMAGTHQLWGYFPGEEKAFPVVGTGMENHMDGPFEECALAQPSSLHRFGQYVVFADSEVSSIRVADFDQRVVGTIVGQGLFDFGDRDGPLEEALLQHPLGAVFHQGMFFVADTFNNKIKKIDFAGKTCATLLGDGRPETLYEPGGIDVAGDFLYIPDTNNHRVVVAKVDGSASRVLSFGS